MTKLVHALAVSLALASTPALAWDGQGHMTVAALAWSQMTSAAKSKAAELLKHNPMYSGWVKGLSDEDARAETAFVEAATWPDLIKRQGSGYQFDGEHSTKPEASQNTGYGDKLQHRYWHFIDMPFSPDGTALRQPEPPNAKDRIALFRKTLTDPGASDALKSYDMVWLSRRSHARTAPGTSLFKPNYARIPCVYPQTTMDNCET